MAANSKHTLDVYQWIEKTIDSCVTREQIKGAFVLIKRFDKIYGSANGLFWNLHCRAMTMHETLLKQEQHKTRELLKYTHPIVSNCLKL